ncbi:hypothetical protein QP794_01800 [Paenibacillus sp. UMB7766-LJ446]|uniref:hypothetical protein n=1 Tax=Paenibacillus sp. UMB7766-LJ446 TaxID=3046313 RepID=UPI00254CC087|nr:hypothetical protein [Paenibacillus sp. UMB7766-LJ446]MDK8188816.1 hypothetical protein [Paenibacillus sp. UMB7766-LJ446]
MNLSLEQWIKEEMKKYSLWAFLDRHGSSGSRYNSGYLQALEDVKEKMKECEQLTLF